MDRRVENGHIIEKREGEKEAYDTLTNRVSQSVNKSVSQAASQSVNKSVYQSVSQLLCQCISKLVSQLISKLIVQQEFQSLRQTISSKNFHRHKI